MAGVIEIGVREFVGGQSEREGERGRWSGRVNLGLYFVFFIF